MSFGLQGAAPAPDMSAKETELAKAAGNGELQTMERLIAEGASADATDESGAPALVLAAKFGSLDALKLLRKHGANREATGPGGFVGRGALPPRADGGGAAGPGGAHHPAPTKGARGVRVHSQLRIGNM